jgi:hypothetical protein
MIFQVISRILKTLNQYYFVKERNHIKIEFYHMGQMTDCWMISINPKSEGSDGEGDVQQ